MLSEEEKKLRKKESQKKYREKNKEKVHESTKKWKKEHKESVKEYDKKYRERHKKDVQKRIKKWFEENKEKAYESHKKWLEQNPEYQKAYDKNRRKTKIGRAENLLRIYKQSDKKNNRGECTLTAKWIVDNIFSKQCSHCDENDWTKIGCNRLNNKLPHTPENVEPCCFKCNAKLRGKDIIEEQSKQVYQYTLDGKLAAIWKSTSEIQKKLAFNNSCISRCCNGIIKTSYGYKWSYEPLN